jgi:hypothetical protein
MFRYKGLTVNLSFGYHFGGKTYNSTLLNKVEIRTSSLSNNVDRRVLSERWHQPGDHTFFKAFSNVATRATTRFVMDDRVFQLQSASVQYRFDKAKFLKRNNIQSLNFAVNMSDLFYLSTIRRERGTSYPFARQVGITMSLTY